MTTLWLSGDTVDVDISETMDYLRENANQLAETYEDGLVAVEGNETVLEARFDRYDSRYDAARDLKERLHDTYDDVTPVAVVDIRDDEVERFHLAGEALWEEAYAAHPSEPAAYLPDDEAFDDS